LIDKFGDNGVVTAALGRIENFVLHIELWLMSCRVLNRDMENALLDELVKIAANNNIKELRGYYYPTKKNNMVRDFYERMGFTKINEDDVGNSVWSLILSDYKRRCLTIDINGFGI
jgi:FkbH-like protein